jgi:hypothetical protein
MHEVQPVGVFCVAYESVRPVGFEQVVVMRTDRGELPRVEGVAGLIARVQMVDVEASRLGTSRGAAAPSRRRT